MNTTILQKCLDELNKESPRLDYVKGMLETVISMGSITTPLPVYHTPTTTIISRTTGSELEEIYNGKPGEIGRIG